MDDNSRVSLTKPSDTGSANNTNNIQQGWRDPATGEIYPQQPQQYQQPVQPAQQGQYIQQGVPQPVNSNWQGGFQQPTGNVYAQPMPQSAPYQPQPYQQDAMPQQYQQPVQQTYQPINGPTKFCKHCGQVIAADAVVCTHCGRQVEQLQGAVSGQPIVINNSNNNNNINNNVNVAVPLGKPKNKWLAVILCFFFGWLGIHRFYEGKIGTGLLYMFSLGLFGLGAFIDFIILLCKPDPYYV